MLTPVPRLFRPLVSLLVLVIGLASPSRAGAEKEADPGELDIRSLLPLDAPARERLAKIIAESSEARALLDAKRQEAAALGDPAPRPLAVIVYEGRLNTDPERIETVRHLHDLDHVGAWFEVWQATGEPELARRCREFIGAWAAAYVPTGNDVNEYKLLPLLVAYQALRPEFAPNERARVDAWVRRLAEPHHHAARQPGNATGNRYAKRLRIAATAALILDEAGWMEDCVRALRGLVTKAFYADGTSHDFVTRDTLTYHTTTIRPLLDLALLARGRGENLYAWESPVGGSLKKSTDFVVPYAKGEKVHAEWVNTQADIDRRRAAAGIAHYQPGRPYEPKQARPLLEEAEFFDPSLAPLVAQLSDRPGTRFPTWRLVLNAALRK